MMKAKTLGVLGGMGPFATSVFFERVIDRTKAGKDQEHLDMVILNHASLPDRTQSIMNNVKQPFLQLIKQDIVIIEQSGVAHIAITCNTTHYFYENIQAITNIPVIHMYKSTIQHEHNRVDNNKKDDVIEKEDRHKNN